MSEILIYFVFLPTTVLLVFDRVLQWWAKVDKQRTKERTRALYERNILIEARQLVVDKERVVPVIWEVKRLIAWEERNK